MDLAKQYCTFWLDGLFFGVSVEKVKEVLRYQSMTQIPHAPVEVLGLINLRGEIVTAIDMRKRLDLPDYIGEKKPKNVIIRDPGGAVSLLVDEIGDVIETQAQFFEDPPNTMDAGIREMIIGVYKLEKNLLLILDVDKVIEVDEDREVA